MMEPEQSPTTTVDEQHDTLAESSKRAWHAPELRKSMLRERTRTWFGGTLVDWSNTTATNTKAS